jgi:hypothetical protein
MNDMSGHDALERAASAPPADPNARMKEVLGAQAEALDAMFTALAADAVRCKPFVNPTAVYTRLALQAQTNCRAAFEAMARADRTARAGEGDGRK